LTFFGDRLDSRAKMLMDKAIASFIAGAEGGAIAGFFNVPYSALYAPY